MYPPHVGAPRHTLERGREPQTAAQRHARQRARAPPPIPLFPWEITAA